MKLVGRVPKVEDAIQHYIAYEKNSPNAKVGKVERESFLEVGTTVDRV